MDKIIKKAVTVSALLLFAFPQYQKAFAGSHKKTKVKKSIEIPQQLLTYKELRSLSKKTQDRYIVRLRKMISEMMAAREKAATGKSARISDEQKYFGDFLENVSNLLLPRAMAAPTAVSVTCDGFASKLLAALGVGNCQSPRPCAKVPGSVKCPSIYGESVCVVPDAGETTFSAASFVGACDQYASQKMTSRGLREGDYDNFAQTFNESYLTGPDPNSPNDCGEPCDVARESVKDLGLIAFAEKQAAAELKTISGGLCKKSLLMRRVGVPVADMKDDAREKRLTEYFGKKERSFLDPSRAKKLVCKGELPSKETLAAQRKYVKQNSQNLGHLPKAYQVTDTLVLYQTVLQNYDICAKEFGHKKNLPTRRPKYKLVESTHTPGVWVLVALGQNRLVKHYLNPAHNKVLPRNTQVITSSLSLATDLDRYRIDLCDVQLPNEGLAMAVPTGKASADR